MAASRIKGITVEINGSTTGLDKALKSTNSTINQVQSRLKDVNRLLKVDPGNTELLTQKQRLLSQAVGETKGKLETLKQAAEQANTALANGDISQEQYDALQREIIETEQRLQDLENQARQSASVLGTQMQLAGDKIREVGSKVSSAGKALMPVTGAIVGIGSAAGKMASDFEDSMAKVSTIADETEVPIGELEDAIMELSNQTGISSSEIASNVYDAISAGQKTGDAVNFVSNSTKLAKAGFAESGAALDLLTTIMNAYGLEAEEVADVSDMLIQTQNLGKTTVADLSSAMGKVIPTAKAQGVELDSLCGVYAVMTSNGIATAETTTYVNSMLNELGKQGTSAANAFAKGTEHIKEGGLTMAEAMESGWELTDVLSILDEQAYLSGTSISNMFGSAEAGKAASVLWDNAEKVNDAVEEMRASSGATDEAFGKLDTTSYRVQKTINELKNTAIELGQQLLATFAPILEDISKKVHELSEWFGGLDEGQRQAIVTVGLVVAALGPLLIIIGTLIDSVGSIVGGIGSLITFVTGTLIPTLSGISVAFLAIPLAIAAVVAAFVDLWRSNEEFRNNIISIWNGIKEKFAEFTKTITDRLDGLGFEFGSITEAIGAVWNGFCQLLVPVFEGVFQQISIILGTVFDVLVGILDVFTGIFTNDWKLTWTGVQEIFGGAWDFVTNTFSNASDTIKKIFDTIKSIIKDGIDKIKGYLNFSWSLPKLKMPHFDISGGFSLNPPSVPHFSVEWYRKAMDQAYILKGASIFGQMNGKMLGGGEAGSEIVAGTQYMMDLIRDATAQSNHGVAEAIGSLENRVVDIMSEYFPVFAEKGETEQYIRLDPHFSVMVGNRQFESYIVQTAERGISGQQRSYKKAKGAG